MLDDWLASTVGFAWQSGKSYDSDVSRPGGSILLGRLGWGLSLGSGTRPRSIVHLKIGRCQTLT